jgi:hypothetical protein
VERLRSRPWLLPTLNVFLTAVLGVAINLATDLKTSWLAWGVVLTLAIAIGLATAQIERRSRPPSHSGGTRVKVTSESGDTTTTSGLVMKTTELKGPDGSTRKTVEFFSEELAVQVFREDFGRRAGD